MTSYEKLNILRQKVTKIRNTEVEMYKNLLSVLRAKGISNKQLAEILGVSEKSVDNKINGRTDFTLPEFQKTCILLKEYDGSWLFEKSKAVTNA